MFAFPEEGEEGFVIESFDGSELEFEEMALTKQIVSVFPNLKDMMAPGSFGLGERDLPRIHIDGMHPSRLRINSIMQDIIARTRDRKHRILGC